MPDAALLGLVVDRIETHSPADGAADLILAAFQGCGCGRCRASRRRPPVRPTSVAQSLGQSALRGVPRRQSRSKASAASVLRPRCTSIPDPGLTLVVGRNGSGKSSFSEALEMVLLGTNQRWEQRVKVWRDGWQNLHHRHTRVAARFTVDGRRQPLEVARVWKDDEGVDGSTLTVDGKPASTGVARLGDATRRIPAAAVAQRAGARARPRAVEAVRRTRRHPRAR